MACTTNTAIVSAVLALLSSSAFAQGAPAPVPDRPPATTAPESRVPERMAPPDAGSGAETRQPGVISPRHDPDPAMAVPPPRVSPNSPSVIPPPGTPGGDQRVQPR
jgi:hypothetical protein